MALSHADQGPSIRLGVHGSRAVSGTEDKEDHARGTEALISRPCRCLFSQAEIVSGWPALQRPQGTLGSSR
jgi:hypothetical protein